MRVAVTGASGLIGSALVADLRSKGHQVVALVRGPSRGPDQFQWDPMAGSIDLSPLAGIDAVVHLAGAGIGDRRWTEGYKETIRDSRLVGTRTLAGAIAALDPPPSVFISGSAVGYYGDTGDTAVDETAPPGSGFLADVVVAWEAAAQPARAAGIRVVHPRTGLVISGRGGAWSRMWPLFQLGLGGKFGSGRQWWSFISLRDEVAALEHLLTDLEGPVNLTAPSPATNAEITSAMGRLLKRPTLLQVPAPVLAVVLGEMSEGVLGSIRAIPARLQSSGFVFRDPTIDAALAYARAAR
ncbi:MAG: TIGR01777 family oxidoreductase [Candidatus Nanopelagicales bacterium]